MKTKKPESRKLEPINIFHLDMGRRKEENFVLGGIDFMTYLTVMFVIQNYKEVEQ